MDLFGQEEVLNIANINIEFAHYEFTSSGGANFDEMAIHRSAKIAKELYTACVDRSISCALSILIDDKHAVPPLTTEVVSRLLAIANDEIVADYICYESNLFLYKDQVLDLLPKKQRKEVWEDMQFYEKKDNIIPCSHDIAIWHLMRLGNIDNIQPSAIIPFGVSVRKSPPLFQAKYAVSVLPGNYRAPEERADKSILKYCNVPDLAKHIVRVYFDDDSTYIEIKGKKIDYTPNVLLEELK
jgi:hypothetical protein